MFFLLLVGICICIGSICGCILLLIFGSVPRYARHISVQGLSSSVVIQRDQYAVPKVQAASRIDAYCALGYLCGRERLFQMDLLRRRAAGRLAEVVGKAAIDADKRQRVLRLEHHARQIFALLPEKQRAILQAYTQGVNAAISQQWLLPPEFLLLRYQPEPWTPEDCLLIGLSLFQELTRSGEGYDRMLTVMKKTLPSDVVEFLTPDDDCYTTTLLGGQGAARPTQPIPLASLARLRAAMSAGPEKRKEIETNQSLTGSNGWCVAGQKTADGRGLLANDMHLDLGLPNIWYRAMLEYEGQSLVGLFIPGLPLPVSGSSNFISWGFTNSIGKFLDLVEIEVNPEQPSHYRVPEGWEAFEEIEELIRVRNRPAERLLVRQTRWGPVSPLLLCEQMVALHWTMLDPAAVNMALIDLDSARTIQDAIPIFHRFGGPPMNVMLVDRDGHIGWTLCGKIPIRTGFDGTSSQRWTDGGTGWRGYLPPEEMPVVIDPPEGFLVTANNRVLGNEYPYPIGYGYSSSYRAYRIRELLISAEHVTEQSLMQMQLDTRGEFYDFYADLLLHVLTEQRVKGRPLLRQARAAVLAWDGKMDLASRGIGLLVRLRSQLLREVLGPYLAPCRDVDKIFADLWYWWDCFETPLRTLLSTRAPETLPDLQCYPDWDTFLCGTIETLVQSLCEKYRTAQLVDLTWERLQRTRIEHPLASALPMLSKWLSMPPTALPGGVYCVRVSTPLSGAAARLVVSPSQRQAGILHMPGGQSGHPGSRHYKDQHPFWQQGAAYALEGEGTGEQFLLHPSSNAKLAKRLT